MFCLSSYRFIASSFPNMLSRVALLTLLTGLVSCASSSGTQQSSAAQLTSKLSSGGSASLEDLHVVDCLVPGQIRQLGSRTYMTPRLPLLTTAADCRLRGGEYVAYDRADYKTALEVWLPSAEQGDPKAQTHVGEIYEKGLGSEPNYKAAYIWYKKAAEQGFSRAQFNLGTLYEEGKGIEKNQLMALNWYRQAWGLPEDSIIFQSAAEKEQQALRDKLNKTLKSKNRKIRLLEKQMQELTTELEQTDTAELEEDLQQMKQWVLQLSAERAALQNQMQQLPQRQLVDTQQHAKSAAKPNIAFKHVDAASVNGIKLGKYYALIVGNQDYQQLRDLETPVNDVTRLKNLLESRYGFTTQMILDADNITLMKAINNLNKVLSPDDNLLIYYAGHGMRLKTGERDSGYWLPTNAEEPPDDTFWLANEFVTRHLARIKAKRVLVVSDSCYSGLLSSEPGLLLMNNANYSEDYVTYKIPKRSRLMMSSGGNTPVLDDGGNGHSVFARAFLDILEENDKVIVGPELFLMIRDQVKSKAARRNFVQVPEYKSIKGAGHEVGDFFFVPKQDS